MKIFMQLTVSTGGIILIFALIVYLNGVPTTDIEILNLGRDTTFYIGRSENNEVIGGQLSVRATGMVDNSTGLVNIEYTNPSPAGVVWQIRLSGAAIETMTTGDFYDQRAKIT